MKSTLFPHFYRFFGWPLLSIGLVLGFFVVFYEFKVPWLAVSMPAAGGELNFVMDGTQRGFFVMIEDNFTNELAALLTLVGSLLVAFSKERVEDEFFQQLRFESMIWALKIQSLLLLLAILFLYGFAFLYFMIVALVSFFVLYIGRYHFRLFKFRQSVYAE